MAWLDRDGVRLRYDVHGSGPVVLLSHGYSATSAMWRPQIGPLSERYTVVTWDMRGHGETDAGADPVNYSEAATVQDMAALLDEVGASRAAIGGLSLGGYMSLAFHATRPQRTAALLLLDTGPGYRKEEGRAGWNAMAERYAQQFADRGLDALGGSAEVRVSAHRSAEGLVLAARGMLVQHDARVMESLPSIAVPTLVLVGERDTQFLVPGEYMASKIPNARHVIVPGAGHAANLDAPDACNQALLGFLDGVTW